MQPFPFPLRTSIVGTRAALKRRPVLSSLVVAAALLTMTVAQVGATYPGAADAQLALTIKDADGNPQINLVSSDGLTETPLTSGAFFHACPAFSADGRQIVYCSNESGAFEIWTMNSDGLGQAQLTDLGGRATFPDISPDGSTVAFGATEGTDPQNQIYTVDATTGGSLTALTSCTGFKPGCTNDVPSWSPDGTQIVYIHADDSDADGNNIDSQVWVMDADGGNAHALTTDAPAKDQLPDWSPDGSEIVYASGPDGSEGIWVMNADGSDPHQLTGCAATDPTPCAAGDDFGPSWSADGQRIGFIRNSEGADERPVMIMNADGTDVHRLTPASTPQFQYVPTWQPGMPPGMPSASGSTGPGPTAFASSTFDIPISLVLDDGWVVEIDRASDIDLQRGDQDAGISSIASMTVPGTASGDPRLPWPDDLYAWLDSRPEFTPMAPRDITVGGRPAIRIDAHEDVPEGTKINMFCVANSTCWLVDYNDWWRFVEVKDADGSGIVAITEGSADMYDASTGALDRLLATLAFR